MSRHILDALMQLFALITLREEGLDRGREVVANFLRSRLNRELVTEWLNTFESYLVDYGGAVESREAAGLKRTALRSTKVLRACADINRDLQASEKALVFLRVLEFELAIRGEYIERDPLIRELIDLVADGFGIREGEKECYETLVFESDQWPTITQRYHEAFLIGDQPQLGGVIKQGWTTALACFRHPESQVVFLRPVGAGAVQLNGELLDKNRTQPFTPGSTLRHPGAAPLHFVDIQRSFMEEENIPELTLSIHEVSHWFQYPEKQALHPLSASAQSGMLVGVMGASGSGKSTLLHLLAGTANPTFGRIELDGIPVTDSRANAHIGLVPQEDHLLPELTVKENLWYAARLAHGKEPESRTEQRVSQCLARLGLQEAQDLPVGDALNKTISGGQRKRLNIALELIREPKVLLVDEPTSGLSSKDSESLMDLLKQMTHTGTLVIAVIHQPSGDIFRSFDALWVLDQGGYPVFTGRPLDALTHFRTIVNHFDAEQVACGLCGHVNPEQIFNIIEVPVLDGRGKSTGQRRISPKEWNDFHNVLVVPEVEQATPEKKQPKDHGPQTEKSTPGWGAQWSIQAARDVNRKIKNRQYLLINLLEAPVLAVLLAILLRATESSESYSYGDAQNIPHFLFVSVIVAIFMGLTVSAEELFQDRLMRKREANLHLNWGAYLTAKCAVLFCISALQSVLFSICASVILELPGHFVGYAFTLFSVAASANMFGLIISLLFNSVRVIYLAIPLFIIPQLMLGGAIVPFHSMHPGIAKAVGVPWPAQTIISRWGFEALATMYASENAFTSPLFEPEQNMARAEYLRDRWVPEMKRHLERAENGDSESLLTVAKGLKRYRIATGVPFSNGIDPEEALAIGRQLDSFRNRQRDAWLKAKSDRDAALRTCGWDNPSSAKAIKREELNHNLLDWTTGSDILSTGTALENHEIHNTKDALYARPKWPGAGQFYSAQSWIGRIVPKRVANWIVLWSSTFLIIAGLVLWGSFRPQGPPRRT